MFELSNIDIFFTMLSSQLIFTIVVENDEPLLQQITCILRLNSTRKASIFASYRASAANCVEYCNVYAANNYTKCRLQAMTVDQRTTNWAITAIVNYCTVLHVFIGVGIHVNTLQFVLVHVLPFFLASTTSSSRSQRYWTYFSIISLFNPRAKFDIFYLPRDRLYMFNIRQIRYNLLTSKDIGNSMSINTNFVVKFCNSTF